MRHSLYRVAPVIAGLLLSPGWGCASRADVTRAGRGAVTGRAVALPSPDFTTYVQGELVRVSIPSNWRELPGSNAVTFAPEGAYGDAGLKSVFTHGVAIGLARNDRQSLRLTTEDFIESNLRAIPGGGRRARNRKVTLGDRPALQNMLTKVSATGEPEQIQLLTTLLRDGTVLYVLAVAPRAGVAAYAHTFRRVVGSIQIMDADRPGR